MSTFSKVNFKTLNYNSFRPHYPSSFYKILANYVTKGDESKLPLGKSIDLGCGTGVATYPLLNISQEVYGLDLSPSMIETANSLIESRLAELGISDLNRIKFKSGAVEDFVNKKQSSKEEGLEEGTIDLITAAQCIHWFKDYDSFFENAAKLLRPGGVLAYFFYNDPVIVDYSGSGADKDEVVNKAKKIYFKYVYDDPKYIGPHWEQPGRNIVKHFLEEVNAKVPKELYTDITINTFKPSPSKPVANIETDLDLKKMNLSLKGYVDYLSTYSGFHNYKDATGDKDNVLELFLTELEQETGWDRNTTKIDLVWNTGYTFIRRK